MIGGGDPPAGKLSAATAETRSTTELRGAPELTVVVPTRNESGNVPELVRRVGAALPGVDWELIFVDDDSPDGTFAVAKAMGRSDGRVRCIRRVGRRGLAGACLEGMLASQASYVAVIDGDLQHDETLLASMIAALRSGACDVVVGSRHAAGGSADALTPSRGRASRRAAAITRFLSRTALTDPMSGFFMLRREIADELAPRLSTQGFKILLDLVLTARGRLRVVELPYHFRPRSHGTSKLDWRIRLEFLGLLVARTTNDLLGARFVLFALTGLVGLGSHLVVLTGGFRWFGLSFPVAQTAATAAAVASNFVLGNLLAYRDQRLVGQDLVSGLLWFHAVSLVGAASSIAVGVCLFASNASWWLAGLGGAIVGAVWNYAVDSVFVWRSR